MHTSMLTIDGSHGEGGGQILRSSLALSMITGTPFRLDRIRAGRRRPGLMRQHLAAVLAAARICDADVSGAEVGSCELIFRPGTPRAGTYTFAVGTAGSATLVLQSILPALMLARGTSEVTLEGGTHNPHAPPWDFLARVFLPLVNRMGPTIEARLERPGFYPAGGGRAHVTIAPAQTLSRLELVQRGELRARRATAMVSALPRHIAWRELRTIAEILGWDHACLGVDVIEHALGPGNVVMAELASEHITELFTGFGERGVLAETVGARVAEEVSVYLAVDAPVGRHLADQLVLIMALAGGGRFRTLSPSLHTRTQFHVLERFLGLQPRCAQLDERVWEIELGGAS